MWWAVAVVVALVIEVSSSRTARFRARTPKRDDAKLQAAYEPADADTDTLPRGSRGVFVGLSRDGTDGALSQRAITPDLRVRVADGLEVHYDAKVVHVGVSTYADTNGAAAARGAAVNSRADFFCPPPALFYP